MKRGIERKNAAKEELSIQDGDHDLPRLRLLASRNSPGLSLLSFTPTLGLFVVQSRNSRDPWESTWESDSMGLIVFSTGKCCDASTCTYTVGVYPFTCVFERNESNFRSD